MNRRNIFTIFCLVLVAIGARQLVSNWYHGSDGTVKANAANQVTMKGRAPVSTELLKVSLPPPVEADLPNGLHLMVLEDHRVPQVTFQIIIPGAGGYYDPPDASGLASVTASLMREGTTSHTSQQISETLETMAATVAISTGLSSVSAQASGSSLTENLDAAFGLTTEILLSPTFPQEELDRFRTRTKTQLIAQRTSPGFLASEMFSKVVFGSHPASRVSLTAEGLDKITRDQMVTFHRQHFVPDHAIVALAGDLTMAEARKLVDAKLGAWKKAGTPEPTVADPPALGPAKVYFIGRPGSVQSSLWIGTQGISRSSPDFDVVNVLNTVLGAGPTGRLFTHLREEKGYTYGAYSSFSQVQYVGNFNASLDVRTEVTEAALKDLVAEITRMRDEAVPEKEFTDRKRSIIAAFALSLESPAAVLNSHITRYLYKLPADYWDKLPERFMAVTQAQVQAAAKKYLAPDRLMLVVVGDPAKVGPLMAQFGTVEMYDVNGKKVGGPAEK
jgi:zinc protease